MGSKEYATVQIDKKIKDQIVNYCDNTGLRIGRFVESLYTNFVSSSTMFTGTGGKNPYITTTLKPNNVTTTLVPWVNGTNTVSIGNASGSGNTCGM